MKNTIFVLAIILFFVNVSIGYGDNTLCSISGTLINEKDSKPMDGVTLALWGYGGIKDGQLSMIAKEINGKLPLKATSDKNGKFLFSGIPEGTYVIVQEIRGISQIDNLIETTQGNLSTPAIKVEKGKSVDIGTIRVHIKN